jgi:N-acetylmuramoyl-L-alanine amidase
MAPLPIAETFSPPPVEHLAADEVGPLEESGFDEPPFDENLPEESLPEAADSEAAPPRWTAPPPQSQSAFVNPALARVAAARPRPAGQREPGEFWLGLRTMVIVMSAALVVSFIFSYWTPNSFLPEDFVANLQEVSSTQGPPTFVPSPLPTFSQVKKIGIINGHSGPPLNPAFTEDPGAICDENGDGIPELRELDINTSVAYRVANLLVADGYEVEILNEWDARIQGYRADALISIHTNTCENLGFGANGFNMTAYERSPMIDRDNILVDCLVSTYTQATGLPRHFGSPPDLVDYHAFRKVSVDTPTVIIELGFMFADRQILVERPDDMAGGIFRGIDCFFQDPATRQEILSLSATPSP